MLVQFIPDKTAADDSQVAELSWLTPYRFYVVYAIHADDTWQVFYIADDAYDSCPISYEASLFHITDPRCSRYWSFPDGASDWDQLQSSLYSRKCGPFIAFPEWTYSSGPDPFYEALLEGYPEEVSIFTRYKALMDLEFALPHVTSSGIYLEDLWVQCPDCKEAWEGSKYDELTICPFCKTLLLNPVTLKHLRR